MIIYKIINLINNKVYIGKTKDLSYRIERHLKTARLGGNFLLSKAIRKYGIDNFRWEVIEQCSEADVNDREKYHISQCNSFMKNGGYNMTLGGDGNPIMCCSKELSKKLAAGQKRRYQDKIQRIYTGLKTKEIWDSYTPEQKTKRSINISLGKSDCWLIVNREGEEIITNCLTVFCKENQLTKANLFKVSCGERSHHKGYWCKKIQ